MGRVDGQIARRSLLLDASLAICGLEAMVGKALEQFLRKALQNEFQVEQKVVE